MRGRQGRCGTRQRCAPSSKSNISEWVECWGRINYLRNIPVAYSPLQLTLEIEFMHQTLQDVRICATPRGREPLEALHCEEETS